VMAVSEAVKHFRHMLEARHFVIFTDHKPLTFAFQQKRDKCLTTAVQPYRLHRLVHNRHKTHFRTE
jgi:hypothetical protein